MKECPTTHCGDTARLATILFKSLVLLLLVFVIFSPDIVWAVTAGKVEIHGLTSVGEQEFLDILGIRPGQEVNAENVRDGIKRAFYKGLFEDISVTVPDGESPTVEVHVRERDFIRKISVKGDSVIREKALKGFFLLKEGQQMRYDLLETSVAGLKDHISQYGFPGAKVGIKVERTDRPYEVNIILSLDAGSPLIVRNIRIVFPPSYSAPAEGGDAVLGRMKLSRGAVYNRFTLEEDLKRIKEYFKKEGYYGPKVGPYSFRDGDLDIKVDPGQRLIVLIDGNSAISTKDLIKEAPFFEIEDFRDEVVGEAIDRMLALYHGKGYPFTQIAPVINTGSQGITITLFVFEGEKVKIKSISFSKTSLPVKSLKDVMSLTEGGIYNPDLVDRDKDSLKEFYGALGYLDSLIKEMDVKIDRAENTASITVDIDEGKKTEIGTVEITGAAPELRQKLLDVAGIKPGNPYNEVDITDARFRILDYYSNHGFTNVDVTVTRSVENYRATVVFKVAAGKERFFGKTVVIGNRQTKYRAFKRELLYKEGEPYSFKLISEERQRLYKLGLFTDVEIETVDGEDSKKDILLRVTEGNAGSVEFGFGYANYEKFRGFVEVSYRNLWGMNREGLIRVEASSLENRIILQYNEPWFLGKKLPFRTIFLYENREELDPATKDILYKLRRYAVTSGVEKRLSDTFKTEFYYEFSLVRTTDVKPEVVLTKEDTGTIAISGIKPALVYDTRDNPFDPKKGVLAGISMKLATWVFLSEANFVKAEVYGSTYHKISRKITLALSARGGVAYGLGNTVQLPLVERFFLGGRSTVRGYAQDTLGPKGSDGTTPTGGNAFLMGNVEFRTDIGRGFGLVPFFDMGNVWLKANEFNPIKMKFTTGLGLRYNTPVGPLRVDYGLKLRREEGESRGEIHFSVGHAF